MGNSNGKEEGQGQGQQNARQSPPEQFQRSPRLSASPRPPSSNPSRGAPATASTTHTPSSASSAFSAAAAPAPASSSAAAAALVAKPSAVLDLASAADDPVAYLDKVFGDTGIPVVFRWDKGGDEAYVTGTFDEWNVKIPMSQSGNDFVHIRNLPRGKHGYKFVVDNQWEFNKDQHSMVEASGNIINFVDLTEFKPKFEHLPDLNLQVQQSARFISEASDLMYGNRIPDINDYTKEPPALPQHLRSIILNSKSGVPQHVSLDHLYCTARKDGIMVLGVSQRFRNKFVTTVYYSPVNGGYPSLVHQSRSSSSSAAAAAAAAASAAASSSSAAGGPGPSSSSSSSSSKRA